jgi:glyoxylate reductase
MSPRTRSPNKRSPNKPLIVLTHPFLPEIVRKELKPHARIRIARTEAQLLQALRRADGLVTRPTDPVDARLLSHAPRLKAIANFAVGTDNIDFEACRARGIRVTNTPGALTRATAELTLALLLAAARRLPEGEKLCRRPGAFKGWAPDMLLGLELKGRHAVIVGAGRIGRETGKLFEAVGLTVQYLGSASAPHEIQQALRRAQVLSFHVPLTPKTRHWLDASRLKLLPRDAIVLNTARGPVIDERALIQALRKRAIHSAGLDVYEREPAIPQALRKLDNVVLLPHLGSATFDAREGMARLAFRGVLALLHGQKPPNEVDF